MGEGGLRASVWIGEQARPAIEAVLPLLEEAVAYDPMANTVESVIEDIVSNRAFIWVVLDENDPDTTKGFIVGSFYVLHGMKEFVLAYAGGNMEYLLQHLDLVEDFARANGASRIKIPGRMGWMKVLKTKDYKPTTVIMSKTLEVVH